jgi:cytochrome oxidase Cu insertion factor (SCO1/SenC/PrrC family)
MAAVCIVPVVASYLAYYWWLPSGHVNYGELIEPHALPDAGLTGLDGQPFHIAQLHNKWVLIVADSGACDDWCREKLVYVRQLRLAQGKEADRIERLWLVTDGVAPDPQLVAQLAGVHVVRADKSPAVQALPAAKTPADHIYIVDPLGNLMMRYPRDADPRKMLKDIARLLRHSKWST